MIENDQHARARIRFLADRIASLEQAQRSTRASLIELLNDWLEAGKDISEFDIDNEIIEELS